MYEYILLTFPVARSLRRKSVAVRLIVSRSSNLAEGTGGRLLLAVRKVEKKQLLASPCLSVLPSVRLSTWNNLARAGRIFIKYDVRGFFENLSLNIIKIRQE